MNAVLIIGVTASILTAISALPQLFKLIKEKKSGDISRLMLGVLIAGLTAWVWYGVLKRDWIIFSSNLFSFMVNTCVLVLTFKYR
jgi:MtN3 and saliva related transmembrane protein